MLCAFLAIASASLAPAGAIALNSLQLSEASPLSAPPAFDLSQLFPRVKTRYPLGDVRENNLRFASSRHAMRKPLQWGTCDENMTLMGSTCVCAAGFYDSAATVPITINSVNLFCTGEARGTNLARSCDLVDNACLVTASAYNPSSDFGGLQTLIDFSFNGGPYISSTTAGQPSWFRIDMYTTKAIAGFSFLSWFNINMPSNMLTYFEIWVGDNGAQWDATGNTRCFHITDQATQLAGLRSHQYFFGSCFGSGRYFYLYQPAMSSPNTNSFPLYRLNIYPPSSCMEMQTCLPCPTGKTSNPNAMSTDDCFVNHGIDVNASVGSVDYNYSSTDFLLPAGYSLLNYTDDVDVFLDNCPAGYYCLSDTTVPTPCPAGTYRDAVGGTEAADCTACPAGAYCPIGSAEPVSCPAGRYRGTAGAQQPTDCALCTAGSFCPQGSVAPQACLVGTYRDTAGAAQAADCPACPAGRYCGAGTSTPSLCAAGTYNDQPGGVVQADCYACPTGHYCEAGTVHPTDCAAGTYRAATGATTAANCLVCPAGQYCPVATTTPESCAAGTFYATTGADEQADCSDCPTGSYCPAGSVTPTACVPGTFRNGTAGATADVCVPCTEGYYCPSASAVPTECPGGTYRNILGATQAADCFACPSGQFCGVATVTPTSCAAGTYRASAGASLVTDCLVCPAAQYCPLATTTPEDCPGGTYRGDTGGVDRSSCTTCPTGRYCPQESSAPTLCPAGTYRAATGANSADDCVACPVGQYCLVRSTVPTDCDAGSYRGTEGAQSQAQCTVCPAGSFCPQKSVAPTACDAGTYRGASGALSAADCLACPAGQHCAAGTVTPSLCNAGSYRTATGGLTQASCTTCPAGAYCVAGSAAPVLCGPGRHRDTPGAVQLSNCLLCMPGTYSLDVGRTTNCPACDANFYCRTSTLKETCPMHTTALAGSYSRLNCKCTPGYSCTYYKRIQAIVTLNATAYDFNNDVGGVRTAFLAAMAAAANVTANHVTINGVVVRSAPTGSRRLLSVASRLLSSAKEPSIEEEFSALAKRSTEDIFNALDEFDAQLDRQAPTGNARTLLSVSGAAPKAEAGIRVFATVANAGRLNHLDRKLEAHRPGLFVSHRWERHSSVTAEKSAA